MNEELKSHFSPVQSEMYQLLLCAFCYQEKVQNLEERLRTSSRRFLLEELTALRHLSNGIILHLCNLDDDSSDWSLRSITKKLGKLSEAAQAAKEGGDLLKKYRAKINTFKTKYRNEFIAHRNGTEYPDPFSLPDYRNEFQELIQLALSALERLWGGDIDFGFKLGSQDPEIVFKTELGLT
jgi:hypothetical protein